MKICLRLHMSGVFDTGWAERMLFVIKKYGDFVAVVGGTIGAVAMMDAQLESEVIIIKEKFSDWVKNNRFDFDVVVNVMYTSDVERMMADSWYIYKRTALPVVGVETNSRAIAFWGEGAREFAHVLSDDLRFEFKEGKDFGTTFWKEGRKEFRRILAVAPGDWILINKIVVGKAETKDVVVICENGNILDIKGATIKRHGVEKLGRIELSEVKIDTIKVLRHNVKNKRGIVLKTGISKKVAYVEHAGYDVLKLLDEGVCSAVTVGDDTTAIVGDIFSRFGIPIIGITDGDADGLLQQGEVALGSIIFKVKSDDEAGRIIFEQVFESKPFYEGEFDSLRERIKEVLKNSLISISIFSEGRKIPHLQN
ncbi:MAG: DUF2117 domain-containing protein [Candidatus Methanomethyliaceae archaeon]|nr:DUF2117 domain-containing protein [Candidatus Methanomethyliaceae archaeon]